VKISYWYTALFVALVIGVSWLVFPGPRELAGIYSQDNKRDKARAMLSDLLRKSPDDPDLNQSMADLLYEAGDVDKAILSLEKVIALRPERVDQLLRLADWRASLGQDAEVVKDLEAALKRLPEADERKPDSVTRRRNVLIRLLDAYIYLDEADAQLATVVRLMPLDAIAQAKTVAACPTLRVAVDELARLARAAAAKDADPVLRATFVEAYGLRRMLADDIVDGQGGPAREKAFLSDTLELLVRGRRQEDAARLAADIDKATGGPTARLTLAKTLSGYGVDKAAQQLMTRLAAERPDDREVLLAMAEQRMDANDPHAAVGVLRRLMQIAPQDSAARRKLGEALLADKSPDEAFALLLPLAVGTPGEAALLIEAAENTLKPDAVAQAARIVQPLAEKESSVGLRLADAWTRVDRPAEAWPMLRAYAAQAEGDSELLLKAITAAAMTKNPAALREAFAMAQRRDAMTPDMLLDIANLLVDAGELSGAANLFGRYLALVPGDVKTALRLAEVQSWRGAPDLSYAVLNSLLATRAGDQALMRKAAAYAEEAGRDPDAFRLYAALHRANPRDKALRASYLRLAQWTGNTAEAGRLLADDSDHEPRSAQKARQAAEAFLAADKPGKALPYLERALSLKLDDIDLRRSLAETYAAVGNVDRQAATLEPLAARGLLSEDEAVLVANRYLARKQAQKALATLQRFEGRKPLPWDAGALLVQTYTLLNRHDAVEQLMRRLKDDYAAMPGRLAAIGDMAVMHKKLDFALACYAAALKADPRNGAALKGQAQIYAWNNDAERAISKFEAYRARRPADIDARYQLGELYYGTDRQDEAHGEYKKTLKLIREARLAQRAKTTEGGNTP
jgi:predicted Zn-dependent protease